MSSEGATGHSEQDVIAASSNPVVHLELHTRALPEAQALYAELCGWRAERIDAGHGSYVALALGGTIGGGVVECETERALWLPYVEVSCIGEAMERARALGATVSLGPREGPAGWRSVIATPAGGELAFWQPKERCR
jgi:predicted enzyme related to lactoylglutathione lyase